MRLDLVKPDLKRHVDNKAKCQRSPAEFKVGDKVAVQDYRNPGPHWSMLAERHCFIMYRYE